MVANLPTLAPARDAEIVLDNQPGQEALCLECGASFQGADVGREASRSQGSAGPTQRGRGCPEPGSRKPVMEIQRAARWYWPGLSPRW
jgi:hypothetical protein